jgi:LPPG:FO 2-phospho-L-lactate transferase
VTASLFRSLGVAHPVLPMTDGECRTIIETFDHGTLTFQTWFVRHRAPRVRRVFFDGSPPPAPGVLEALGACDVVVFGPSNPYVSIDPILSIPGVREAVFARPCVALSPIVRGAAIKGPLAQMIEDLRGEPASPGAVVRHYEGGLAGMVVERGDEGTVSGVRVLGADTVMKSREESLILAHRILDFAKELA